MKKHILVNLFASPVKPAQRIDQIDILRGFALLGILLVNVFGFHASFYHFGEFYQGLENPLQLAIYKGMVSLGSDKFIFLFSILFGYGFWMLSEKFAKHEKDFAAFYTRRMLSLCLIGILHITLLWAGDILFLYGILGLFLLVLRKMNTRFLFVIALLSYFFTAWFLLFKNLVPFLPDPLSTTSNILMDEVVKIYSGGGYFDILLFRLNEYITFRNINLFYYAPKIFSLFIFGYVCGRQDLLNTINNQQPKFRFITFVFLLAGLFISLNIEFILLFLSNPDSKVFAAAYIAIYEFGNGLLGFGYLLLILIISQTKTGYKILSPFKYAGRMALTNYLMQSVIFTTLFYGYGFGFFGNTNPSTFVVWALLVFIFQLVLSKMWLSKFRYGPMEFVWRRMTYGNWLQK